jgi:uncharacterized protein DUF3887
MRISTWFARALAAVAALALVGGLAACTTPGQAGAAKPAQPPATAPPSAGPSVVDYDQLALDELDKVVNGSDEVTSGFDDAMQQRLSADQVAASWAAYQQQFGNYQSHGEPADVPRGALTVVDVPLTMERGPGLFRVTFDPDGHIAGLFLLKSGTPVS